MLQAALINLWRGNHMNKNYYIIGLPESGKTSFIGALGFYLVWGNTNMSKFLMDTVNYMVYINDVAMQWAKCEKVSRTNKNAFYNIILNLVEKETGNKVNIKIPDQSGETFRHIINERVINEEKYRQLLDCSDFLIFINPSRLKRDALIPDIPEEIRNETSEEIEMSCEPHLNIQAEYVQILQYLYYIKKNAINLKIIVSAWDMYSEYKIPEQVLKDKVPLVWQYLHTNIEKFKCEFWGISAQGGDLDDQKIQERLVDYDNQIERIIVVNHSGEQSNDITSILA